MKLILTLLLILSFNSFAYECHGTEPFWSAKVNNKEISLKHRMKDTKLVISKKTSPAGMPDKDLSSVRILWRSEKSPLAVIVTNNICSNGMNDYLYPKNIVLFLVNETLKGCCGKPVNPNAMK